MNPSSTHPSDGLSPANSRRQFLLGAAALAVAPFTSSVSVTGSQGQTSLPSLAARQVHRLDDYLPCVGAVFTEVVSGKLLVLANADPAPVRHAAGGFEQFSLRFTPPSGEVVESRLYELHHPRLGRVELFLTPVGSCIRHGGIQKGEAIISHARALA